MPSLELQNPKVLELHASALTVMVMGASGDLAKKKTYPSLYALFIDGFLPKHTTIWGYARSKKTQEEFHAQISPYLSKVKQSTEDQLTTFLAMCFYHSGQYASADNVAECAEKMLESEKQTGLPKANRLFYLALPPDVFASVCGAIKQGGTTQGEGWNRVIVEKPFGHDLESCLELSKALSAVFSEDHYYRIDHYLGKEMVQNIVVLRFGNSLFEQMFNRDHIASVMITFKEDIGTMGRGGYFDKSGIIRDVMQNHLLQVLSIIAMEPPVSVTTGDGNYLRDEKVKVLRSMPPIKMEDVVLGQYMGREDGSEPGYLEDDGVPNDSICPTFCTAVMYVNNPRWAGVPFIMKAGKALNERKAEVRIQMKNPAGSEFLFEGQSVPRNELVMRLQPSEAIYMKTNIKMPGLAFTPKQCELDLSYDTRFDSVPIPDAYTRLILEVLLGNSHSFVRDDELEAAWKIFTPLLHQIEAERPQPLQYAFGSRGPSESDALIASKGFVRSESYEWTSPKAEKEQAE